MACNTDVRWWTLEEAALLWQQQPWLGIALRKSLLSTLLLLQSACGPATLRKMCRRKAEVFSAAYFTLWMVLNAAPVAALNDEGIVRLAFARSPKLARVHVHSGSLQSEVPFSETCRLCGLGSKGCLTLVLQVMLCWNSGAV